MIVCVSMWVLGTMNIITLSIPVNRAGGLEEERTGFGAYY